MSRIESARVMSRSWLYPKEQHKVYHRTCKARNSTRGRGGWAVNWRLFAEGVAGACFGERYAKWRCEDSSNTDINRFIHSPYWDTNLRLRNSRHNGKCSNALTPTPPQLTHACSPISLNHWKYSIVSSRSILRIVSRKSKSKGMGKLCSMDLF